MVSFSKIHIFTDVPQTIIYKHHKIRILIKDILYRHYLAKNIYRETLTYGLNETIHIVFVEIGWQIGVRILGTDHNP